MTVEPTTSHPLAGGHQSWWDRALKNLPRLPEGHTNIDVNHHNRDRLAGRKAMQVHVDRRRFDEELGYGQIYDRG